VGHIKKEGGRKVFNKLARMNQSTSKIFFFLAALFLIAYVVVLSLQSGEIVPAANNTVPQLTSEKYPYVGLLLMGFFVMIAVAFRGYALLKGYSYTVMILL
jgi:bile acid:Na+ symporter, BASS family